MTVHQYEVRLTWTGNQGAGTQVPHRCFAARSLSVPIHHQPTVVIESSA